MIAEAKAKMAFVAFRNKNKVIKVKKVISNQILLNALLFSSKMDFLLRWHQRFLLLGKISPSNTLLRLSDIVACQTSLHAKLPRNFSLRATKKIFPRSLSLSVSMRVRQN